ncbi:MAG: YceI family protein [Cyclobacteriaceae bacterium]
MKYPKLLFVFTLALTYCKKPNNSSDATQPETTIKVYPGADTLEISINESVITWIGSKPTGQHDGTMDISGGYGIFYVDELVGGEVQIDISSLRVMDIADKEKNKKLTSHLLSSDFFDENSFPVGSFQITKITPYDSTFQVDDKVEFPSKFKPEVASSFVVQNPSHVISGSLTLRGKTNDITFPALVTKTDSQTNIEAKFNIDRTRWDLSHNDEANIVDKAKDKFIYNTVNVGFHAVIPIPKIE